MTGLLSSFQSERHIAPCVILFVVVFHHAYGYIGRGSSGVLGRSETVVFSWFGSVEARYGQPWKVFWLSDEKRVKSQI